MIQRFAAVLLTLPVTAVLMAAPAQAQYYSSQPDASRDAVAVERLPPPGANLDDNGDYVAQPARPGQVPPVVSRGPQWLPGYRDRNQRPLPSPGFAATGVQPAAAKDEPDVIRPPQPVGTAPQAATPPDAGTAALPPEDQPETGQPKELPPNLKRQLVEFATKEPAGTIVVDTANTYLYLVLGGGKALRYGVRVGREGFTWTGTERISRMKEWPDWFPPPEMIERQPYLPRVMAGGAGNPLGARAMYLGHTLYRIHGTNQPSTIGHYVSSGCVGMLNEDVEDLYGRVQVGTRVVVLPGNPAPETASNGASAEAR
jgi:lipoprotein-anchoring transpeptidase ErfK/SrfK